jgi:hypothetical protein
LLPKILEIFFFRDSCYLKSLKKFFFQRISLPKILEIFYFRESCCPKGLKFFFSEDRATQMDCRKISAPILLPEWLPGKVSALFCCLNGPNKYRSSSTLCKEDRQSRRTEQGAKARPQEFLGRTSCGPDEAGNFAGEDGGGGMERRKMLDIVARANQQKKCRG